MGLICFSDAADGTKEIVQENWLVLLFRELEKQGITLPERCFLLYSLLFMCIIFGTIGVFVLELGSETLCSRQKSSLYITKRFFTVLLNMGTSVYP